jgi:hypothetical protein
MVLPTLVRHFMAAPRDTRHRRQHRAGRPLQRHATLLLRSLTQGVVSLGAAPSGRAPQVSRIDVTKESPCGHGYVTCLSVYCGPDADFGASAITGGRVRQSKLWVDMLLGGDAGDEASAALWRTVYVAFVLGAVINSACI